VTLKVDFGDGRLITGKGASTDVIEASARAYVNAINRSLLMQQTTPGIEMPVV
jgi:2-isopropylmalate synthase